MVKRDEYATLSLVDPYSLTILGTLQSKEGLVNRQNKKDRLKVKEILLKS